MTSELPQPDIRDSAGRLQRLIVSFGLGVAAAVAAYVLADQLAQPDELVRTGHTARGAYKFVYYVTALAGASVFTIALVIQNHLAKKSWRQSLVAPARTIKQ